MVSDATFSSAQYRSVQQNPALSSSNNENNRTSARQGSEGSETIQNETRTQNEGVARSQNSEARNNGQQDSPALRSSNENSTSVQFTGNEPRGSVVDITL